MKHLRVPSVVFECYKYSCDCAGLTLPMKKAIGVARGQYQDTPRIDRSIQPFAEVELAIKIRIAKTLPVNYSLYLERK